MAKPPRMFDEELGKRDDDHKLRIKPNRKMAWYNPQGPLRRLRRKRMAIGAVVLICLYVFVKFLPEGVERKSNRPIYKHLPDNRGRPPPRMGDATEVVGGNPHRPKPKPAGEETPAPGKGGQKITPEEELYWYDGPIRFMELRSSLMLTARMGGNRWVNKNVMFTASNLKSAAKLLPMACEMAREKKNDVHFAIVGRESMSIADIQEINGVDKSCDVLMHDARPDRSFERTTESMELSVQAALGHLRNYVHPQAVIVDNPVLESEYFVDNARLQSKNLDFTLIELPKRSDESLRWLTRLDSASLNAYNRVNINILIHAQPSGSGSILRLLHSLARADYFESAPPHISIELPHNVDDGLRDHLQSFKWPPQSSHAEDSRLTLQKRISSKALSTYESAIRFLEGFWPADARNSHVLVLSPQVEVSPLYYHYLKYTILDYKYSSATRMPNTKDAKMRDKLLGISLSLPSTYLNDTTAFTPPAHMVSKEHDNDGPSFLWSAPNSEAALYFGDKWAELHDFVSHSLSVPAEKQPVKRVATTYPSWLEYILSYSLTRGSSMVYPQLASGSALATVHNELYTPPEEFSVAHSETDGDVGDVDFTVDAAKHLSLKHEEAPVAHGSMLDMLDGGSLLPIKDMPILSWDGRILTRAQLLEEAEVFSQQLRVDVGECTASESAAAKLINIPVAYLFCQSGEKSIPVPIGVKTPPSEANIVDLEGATDPKASAAAAPQKSQVSTDPDPTKTQKEAQALEKASALSSTLAVPTSKAAADAKALEVEQLGGAGPASGEVVVEGTRYATTPEGAYHEAKQVESAQAGEEETSDGGSSVKPPAGTRFDTAVKVDNHEAASEEVAKSEAETKASVEDGKSHEP